MANCGRPDSNSSQFYITQAKTPWLDGFHVVFGEVIKGFDIIKSLEECCSTELSKSEQLKPIKKITIINCGELTTVKKVKKTYGEHKLREVVDLNIYLEPWDGKHEATLVWLHGLGDNAYGYLDVFKGITSGLLGDRTKVVLLTAPER